MEIEVQGRLFRLVRPITKNELERFYQARDSYFEKLSADELKNIDKDGVGVWLFKSPLYTVTEAILRNCYGLSDIDIYQLDIDILVGLFAKLIAHSKRLG